MKITDIPTRQHSDEAWRRKVEQLQAYISALKQPDPRLAELIAAATGFFNESPQEGDYALLLCSLTANVTEAQRGMVEEYGSRRKRLRTALAAYREAPHA